VTRLQNEAMVTTQLAHKHTATTTFLYAEAHATDSLCVSSGPLTIVRYAKANDALRLL
jgi:hypothetical protein